MTLRLRDPKFEMLPIDRIIRQGEEIGLINPGMPDPVTFHPVVGQCGPDTLTLHLPEKFWSLVQVAPGLPVQLTKTGPDKMYYTEGSIDAVQEGKTPNLTIRHDGRMLSAQRRLFYRFQLCRRCRFSDIVEPDGRTLETLKAVVQDVSPSGIGFKASRRLPRETRFRAGDLFRAGVSEMDGMDFYLQVMWVKGNRWFGFRHGAVFRFASEKDQDDFNRALSRLQINRLSWFYHHAKGGRPTTLPSEGRHG